MSVSASAAQSGTLLVRLTSARGLFIPSIPPTIEDVLRSRLATSVAAVTPSSITARKDKHNHRVSFQRQQYWWLPYVILEFDKNEVIIDGVGGDIHNPVWMYTAQFDVSRSSHVSVHLYLRNEPPPSGSAQHSQPSLVNTIDDADIYLGSYKSLPDFDFIGGSREAWYSLTGESGEINIQIAYMPNVSPVLNIESFDLLGVIGKASFGNIIQVRKRDTSRIYALKTIRKTQVKFLSEHKRQIVLARTDSPFVVPLKFAFQSEKKLYLALPFINGGELFRYLQQARRFSEGWSRFYAAEILLALMHLHQLGVIYRDLKPQNIFLDYTGHIVLCDFGLFKLYRPNDETTDTFCGEPEYLAPELLLGQRCTKSVDWWILGTVLYEMLAGLTPFYHESTDKMYHRILKDPLRFPKVIGPDARSLLSGLLTRNARSRLGSGPEGAEDIKRHPFFAQHTDWGKLSTKEVRPPFKPGISHAIDTSFDDVSTAEAPLDSVVVDSQLSIVDEDQFAASSYNGSYYGDYDGGY